MSPRLAQVDSLGPGFREAMAHVCTPVAVVTAFDGGRPHGTTVSAFMSLSMGPPMVAVALDHGSDLLGLIRSGARFGVNVLAAAQADIALNFARKGVDKFDDVAWHERNGLPAVEHTSSWLACAADGFADGGDHTVVFGTVLDVAHVPSEPLTYHRRTFGTHREYT
ncbi:flavin reductase family protein [Gordonia bronchialis]|uniref:flavin reductase family protein n=1 Tax=Gordonia bronchialis TaxID=2054 RepID=UPI002430C028|nr:flavin reductase family protein [Gordonia bronchialis]